MRIPDWLAFLPGAPQWRLPTLIGLCFFVGAVGKSAQLPLYVWLPDAMAGPTPVSALIHAATMVTAGVYMVCRLGFLYDAAPGAAALIAWIGGLTALFAATIAIVQTDIKKVLAYSTVSQLGYMFLAAGCGGYGAAMFHLVTHAFFKALLFLGAGAVILATHHEQDTDRMGGLWRKIPRTHAVFLVGVLAIAGFPPLSGFFSKDEVLLSAYLAHVPGHRWLWAIGLVTAAITAFYMFRLHFLHLLRNQSAMSTEDYAHVHEPGSTVMVPLFVLAVLSVVGGLRGPAPGVRQRDRGLGLEQPRELPGTGDRPPRAPPRSRRGARARGPTRSPRRCSASCSPSCSTSQSPGLPARIAAALAARLPRADEQVLRRRALRRRHRAAPGRVLGHGSLPRRRRAADRRLRA